MSFDFDLDSPLSACLCTSLATDAKRLTLLKKRSNQWRVTNAPYYSFIDHVEKNSLEVLMADFFEIASCVFIEIGLGLRIRVL